MMDETTPLKELEVDLQQEAGKAVIVGKTVVPFQSLVTLILQRKVQLLFKQWGKEPVVVASELLTGLASAPQDSQENKSHLLIVAMGVGILAGVGGTALTLAVLELVRVPVASKELLIVAGVIFGIGCIAFGLMKMQRVKRGERVVENIEKLSSFLTGK